jgi:hypothetical protein
MELNRILELELNEQAQTISQELSFNLNDSNSEEQAENYDRAADEDFADWVDANF